MYEDRATMSLEDQLGTFVANLQVCAQYHKLLEAQRQQQAIEERDKDARRREFERAVSEEHARMVTFMAMFANWQRAKECRDFLGQISKVFAATLTESELVAFRVWALQVIDAFDPLVGNSMGKLMTVQDHDNDVFNEAIRRFLKRDGCE